MDGLAVEIVYEKGVFTVASTRGDGYVGENVTSNIKTILTVPLTLTQPKDSAPVPDLLEGPVLQPIFANVGDRSGGPSMAGTRSTQQAPDASAQCQE